MKFLNFIALVLVLFSNAAVSTVNLSFQSGIMRDSNGAIVNTGSLGLLVIDTLGNGFGTESTIVGSVLSNGSSLGGSDNLILKVMQANDSVLGGGLNGFVSGNLYPYTGDFDPGDKIALYWFPTISTIGATVGSGVEYGFYRSDMVDIESGSDIAYIAPPDGWAVSLATWDDTLQPGTLATPADLSANFTTIPEPSTFAMLLGGFASLIWLRRKQK